MKKATTLILALALGAFVAQSASAANTVRISQVYGGGGGSSPLYNFDYVELFNNSGAAVNIGGWAVEYGSPTGNWGSSAANIVILPVGASIPPCGYYLIQTGGTGSAGGPLPVAADFVQAAGPAIGQTNGKVAVFTVSNPNIPCGSEVGLQDKVAFGTANCPEGTAAGALTNIQAVVRNGGGTVDNDNNSTDFAVVANPVPRNSSSPANVDCLATPTMPSTWGKIKVLYR